MILHLSVEDGNAPKPQSFSVTFFHRQDHVNWKEHFGDGAHFDQTMHGPILERTV